MKVSDFFGKLRVQTNWFMRALGVAALFLIFALPTTSFASSSYDCGNGGDFPMTFAGCKSGYYYENYQGSNLASLTPNNVGECLECPSGYVCAGGFAGPTSGSPCATGYYGLTAGSCTACTNKPAHSTYTGNAATNNCPWTCDSGYGESNGSCITCPVGQFVADGACRTAHFSVTTTNNTSAFGFYMSAAGTFYIDWGDGTVQTINRTNNTGYTKYEHQYSSAGAYTVRFGGTATGYNADNYMPTITFNEAAACYDDCDGDWSTNIASVSGSLSALFPMFGTNDGRHPSFSSTFSGCTGLTSIPAGLFSGITTGAAYMFYYTFSGCTGLTSIPADLFSGITTGAQNMFSNTFYGCTGLTSIPAGLFSGITTGANYMFSQTFYGCTGITGYIPKSTFAGLIGANSPTATGMWSYTFQNTQLGSTCPSGTTQYATGYENEWGGKVSCISTQGLTSQSNITYELNGGTNYANAPTTYYHGAGAVINGTPTKSGYIFDGWCTDSGLTNCAMPGLIPANATGDKTFYAKWIEQKFAVTTTANQTTLEFKMTAISNNPFYVDCGNGGTLSQSGTTTGSTISGTTITRTNVNSETTYTCTWGTGAAQTVKFDGVATGYNASTSTAAITFYTNAANAQKVASVSGNMSAMFPYKTGVAASGAQPRFYQTFYNATNLTNIDENLFANYTTTTSTYMFYYTFSGCTGLTSIPAGLFSGITTGANYMFSQTFRGCTGLTSIPAGLFSGITTGANYMFQSTFYGCTGLTSIPARLFSGITTGAERMFIHTFNGCTGLTSIPAGLFSGITTGANSMFRQTFYDCTNIKGYIPKSTFAGLIAAGSPTATNMWTNTFTSTQLSSTCPGDTTTVETTYKGTPTGTKWGNYAMCQETSCTPGQYLNLGSCQSCPENSYCTGGTSAALACSAGTYSPAGSGEAAQCGRILHLGDEVLYLRSTKITSPALHFDVDHDGVADYFGNMTTADVAMHAGSERKFKVKSGNITYSVYDDTVTIPE